MQHFGIALGVITAVAIGGALVLDHETKNKVIATPAPKVEQAQMQPTTDATPAIASESSVKAAPSTKPQLAELQVQSREESSVKTTTAPRKASAPSAPARRTVRTSSETVMASSNVTQPSISVPATMAPIAPVDNTAAASSPPASPPAASPPPSASSDASPPKEPSAPQ